MLEELVNQGPWVKNLGDYLSIKDCQSLSCTSLALQPYFRSLIQWRFNEIVRSKLEVYFGDDMPLFVDALRKSGAVISGSFVLQILLGKEWDSSDIDIFTGNDALDGDFSLIERFLYIHSGNPPSEYEDERLSSTYSKNILDFESVINYEISPDKTKGSFYVYGKPIYDAYLENDVEGIKSIVGSMPKFTEFEQRVYCNLLEGDDETILREGLGYAGCLYIHSRESVLEKSKGKSFQVIRKKCNREKLIENIFKTFDFDFCKAVCYLDENDRFQVTVHNWESIYGTTHSFPSYEYYKDRVLWITIIRYFKYKQRGFDIKMDHSAVIRDLVFNWEKQGLNRKKFELDMCFDEIDELTPENTLEEIRDVYLRFLRHIREHALYPFYVFLQNMIERIGQK